MEKIAFDVDGIFTNLQKYLIEKGTKFFRKEPIKKDTNELKDMFGISKKQEISFWIFHMLDYSKKLELNPASSLVIKELQEAGKDIYIITARILCDQNNFIGNTFRNLLIKKFEDTGIKIDRDKFYFVNYKNATNEKIKILKENNIECIVEDSKEILEALKGSSIVPIAKTYDYNESIEGILRFNSLLGIKNHLINNDQKKFVYHNKNSRDLLNKEEKKLYYEKLKEYYLDYESKIDFEKSDRKRYQYYYFGQIIFDLFINADVRNTHLIPEKEGFIIVANHQSMIDTFMVLKALGINRSMIPIFKKELSKTIFAPMFNNIGAIYSEKNCKDSDGIVLDKGTNVVLKGRNLLIFPEGTRNKTDQHLQKLKKGALTIAQRTGEPVLPITIAYKANNNRNIINVNEPFFVNQNDDIDKINLELSNIFEKDLVEFGYQRKKRK